MKTKKTKKKTERKLIDDISLMALDSECRLFVGTEEDITVEEAMSQCQLPESVFEYQRETGCSYENIISLFDRATNTSNLISMFLIRVEGLEVLRHSNYQILTADYNRAVNYIIDETGRIEYDIAVFKSERSKKCKHALKEELVGHPIPIEETYNTFFEDRKLLDYYGSDIREEGEQVIVGNAVGIRVYNHYLEEKKQQLDNEIALLEKKIYICLFNEAIDGAILYQNEHLIVSRMTSRFISNIREDLEELQEDYDYENKVKELIEGIIGLEDIYYAKFDNTKAYYSFNRKKIIKYIEEEIVKLQMQQNEALDLFNNNGFVIDMIQTNISEETLHNLIQE